MKRFAVAVAVLTIIGTAAWSQPAAVARRCPPNSQSRYCPQAATTTTVRPPTTATTTTIRPTTTTIRPTTTTVRPTTTTSTLRGQPLPTGGFPNASNSGVPSGVTLTSYSGPTTLAAGTVIDSKVITQCLKITQPNVIIRRSRIQAACGWSIDAQVTSGPTLIEDSEVICSGGNGIGEWGFVGRRVEIRGCENGIDGDANFVIEDSYIYAVTEAGGEHGEGIQSCCAANVTIRHNTIIGRSGDLSGSGGNTTSAIILPINNPPPGPILIANNFLAGGAYTLYCASTSNQSVVSNVFADMAGALGAEFGYISNCQQAGQFSGNVTDTGQPVGR
jgi:hypothetical protein